MCLPHEVLVQITDYLDIPAIGALAQTSKAHNGSISEIVTSEDTWFNIVNARFNICSNVSISAITSQSSKKPKKSKPRYYGGRNWQDAYRNMSLSNRIPKMSVLFSKKSIFAMGTGYLTVPLQATDETGINIFSYNQSSSDNSNSNNSMSLIEEEKPHIVQKATKKCKQQIMNTWVMINHTEDCNLRYIPNDRSRIDMVQFLGRRGTTEINSNGNFSTDATFKSHIQQAGGDRIKNDKKTITTRRDILSSFSSLTVTLAATTVAPQTSKAASSSIRILKYPPLEYLEPIYELKLSIDALEKGLILSSPNDLNNNSNNNLTSEQRQRQRVNIQKRLEKLFGGGIFSEKNYYLGLAVTYNNQIVYDTDRELSTYINLDKDERLNYIDSALKSLESLKNTLKKVGATSSAMDENTLMNDVDSAQKSIKAWFAMVPSQDMDDVDNLFRITRGADVNRDGKLDASELATLPEKEREIWLKRIALAGD